MKTTVAKHTADRAIPPMSYPRRVRAAASLTWRTLRTGQYLPAVYYMQGVSDGMDTAMSMAATAFSNRGGDDSQGGAL